MKKAVKTGRCTGKTTETLYMMKDNKNLYTIVPSYMLKFDLFRDMCTDLGFSKDITDDIMHRIVDHNKAKHISNRDFNAQFHIEEADWILRELLGIEFNTMTTSHWYVETFRRNDYEKEGL